jgi:hypothetical protein
MESPTYLVVFTGRTRGVHRTDTNNSLSEYSAKNSLFLYNQLISCDICHITLNDIVRHLFNAYMNKVHNQIKYC